MSSFRLGISPQALARIADIRMVPTDDELEELGWGGPGEGARFKWMLATENGETSRIIPRRLSANGIGSTSQRLLADKVRTLLPWGLPLLTVSES